MLFQRIKQSPIQQGYSLVWSDEFNYEGIPNNAKWGYDYGFIANHEKQYYVDSLKNTRVENGHLIIEVHEEIIANEDYGNPVVKEWVKYIREIDSAKYTSARITTEDVAS